MICHRKQHREELVKLQQQLKSVSASGKGGAAEAERSKKELEKLRCALHFSSLQFLKLVPDSHTVCSHFSLGQRE